MTASTPAVPVFIFPHPVLTPVKGKPSFTTLKQLRKEIYANARTIHSTRGGGVNGHLAVLMPVVEYQGRTNGVAFARPVHPGPPPVHTGFVTPVEIDDANRQHDRSILEFKTYNQASNAFKA